MKFFIIVAVIVILGCGGKPTVYQEYYSNGKIKLKGTKCDDALCDSFYAYYPSGNLQYKGVFKDDFMEGTWIYFYANGSTQSIQELKKGNLININFWDSASGKQTIINGTGQSTIYHPNGKVKVQQNFVNNKIDGLTVEYDSFGNIVNTYKFENGILISSENSTRH